MLTEISNSYSINPTYYYDSLIYNGICYDIFENEQIKFEGNILKGKKNGLWKSFYKNGSIKSITHYDLGREDSCWLYFYPNGNLQKEINFEKGTRHGMI